MTKNRIKRKMRKFIYGKIIGEIFFEYAEINNIKGQAMLFHIEQGDMVLVFASEKKFIQIKELSKLELRTIISSKIYNFKKVKTSYNKKIGKMYFSWLYIYQTDVIYTVKNNIEGIGIGLR